MNEISRAWWSAGCESGAVVPTDDPDVSEVLRGELLLLDPAIRHAREAAAGLIDPEFREFGASGRIWDFQSILDMMVAERTPPPAAEDFAPVRLAPDVILVTYRARRAGRTTLRSSLWRRRPDGRWQLYFHQGTPAGEG